MTEDEYLVRYRRNREIDQGARPCEHQVEPATETRSSAIAAAKGDA